MSVLRRATVPRAPSPRRSVVGRGLAGVLLSFAVLATLQALTIHPFHPPDEMSHVGYALEVGHGRLPTIETPISGREIPLLQHKVDNSRPANRTIWTANHPPLYYLVAAVPLRLGVELGHPTAGIRVARLVNVAISLAGLVLIVLLARELVPARPELWVGAAGLAALVPVFVQTSAIVYNDALMVALTTAVLLLIARVLRWGPTRRRLVLLAVLAAAAALTRASGLVVVAAAGVAAVVAVWRQDGRPGRSRAVRAIAAGGAIVVTATAAAGWFYLRNRHLYHSATGTGALLAKFSRLRRGTVPQMLLEQDFWRSQVRRLWDQSPSPAGKNADAVWWCLTVAPLLGLAFAGVRWLRRALPPPTSLLLAWLAGPGPGESRPPGGPARRPAGRPAGRPARGLRRLGVSPAGDCRDAGGVRARSGRHRPVWCAAAGPGRPARAGARRSRRPRASGSTGRGRRTGGCAGSSPAPWPPRTG